VRKVAIKSLKWRLMLNRITTYRNYDSFRCSYCKKSVFWLDYKVILTHNVLHFQVIKMRKNVCLC
jgi:hypothetical protein